MFDISFKILLGFILEMFLYCFCANFTNIPHLVNKVIGNSVAIIMVTNG